MRLQSKRPDAGTSVNYSPGVEERPREEGVDSQRRIYPVQQGIKIQFHSAVSDSTNVAEEGIRNWTDDEVKALLCVWADRNILERLKSTLRNKSIFQEMARQMQRQYGVIRDWRQCRTKYKNLKYDYKIAKSAHAAGGSSAGSLGKYMKFFDEVEAILLDKGLENGSMEMQKRLYDGELKAGRLQTPAGHTGQITGSESEVVIDMDDDDNSDDCNMDGEMEIKRERSTDAHRAHTDFCSDQVVTVSDAGRNWSDQEVQALIQVWSDERICRKLESSTRKRDIFVQISRRLLQQGIDRDWKQCHTKYRNLKYLYRSLQRGKTDEADPRCLMRFYEEVDSIMNRVTNDYTEEDSDRLTISDNCDEKNNVDGNLANTRRAAEDKTCTSDSDLTIEASNTCASESEVDKENTTASNRRLKRKAVDEDPELHTSLKKLNPLGPVAADRLHTQCKEEQDHIPILKINSVCSVAPPAPSPQACSGSTSAMASTPELKIGQKLNEGKTKQIFELVDQPGLVLVQSKDQITAGNAVSKDQMEGKAAVANKTTSCVFQLLQESGIKTAFVKQHSDTAFIAARCEMIPVEWVCRRVATGSFLKRNPGVKEGYRFSPLKMEMFFKDDANNDPQWSEEQLLEAKLCLAGLTIGQCEVDIMSRSTVAIFEIVEKAWATQNCSLVDMKIEFGVSVKRREIVLADVIDNDSWRLWPAGDRSQQTDKQVYRELKEVTPKAMQMVKRSFEWVSERVKLLLEPQASSRVVLLMGSTSDVAHCEKIRKACASYGIPCVLRVTSAHKGPDETLRIKAEYEGDGIPTVFVAVAGRSNGLGPVMSGNTAYPVISCPPLTPDWGPQDVWSSLRMPSGLGCSTVLSPEACAQFAAQILGLRDHLVWCKLRASMLNTWVSLKLADKKLQACSL
ncbi:uncharacterized protein LOC102292589 isoform X2 [Haplochromis burtoni]|uniref:uncharacterized protein LOC102292589 isoform X2 n=1 Tax=Haplochromis burtoni TaxID=8153 RepID=UPI0003BD20FA|nr:uncharacterized protein LOC102292589 isoform X2 [Haplochromis burtoni]